LIALCLAKLAQQGITLTNGGEIMEQKMVVLSTTKVKKAPDTYKIVDALNRTLKEKDLLFGLALDENDHDTMVFTIYRT
jgi:putative AlgH/UPF0301 family transcriptional regulator